VDTEQEDRDMTTDEEILARIGELVTEEDRLRGQHRGLEPAERERLDRLEVALDQCWDLLRQRRARREFGHEPDFAEPRIPEVVEQYDQ
jgi:hypothetical protein